MLDAPPPGTFNYSDTREYTPAEAIDLLNGVLQTKGYTLIRRGRMLLVINLKGGLPEGVVPQVTLDELDSRGKFEMVTVRFPIGRRPIDAVVKEITPLLGPYGKVVPMPASAQVQVTESAGVMRSVKALIQSIAEPQSPAPSASEPLVLSHYAIKPADPQTVLTTFKALFPTTKIAYDDSGDQLHVLASPAEQAMAKKLMEDMRSGNPTEKQSRLELYTVSEGLAPQVLSVLKTILPKAILTLDSKTGKIAAWGLAADHETIKQTIAKLREETAQGMAQAWKSIGLPGPIRPPRCNCCKARCPRPNCRSIRPRAIYWLGPRPPNTNGWPRRWPSWAAPGREAAPQVEVFRLTKASPTVTLQLLETLAPHAKLSLDSATNSIVALANAEDRKTIRETIERVQAAHGGANALELSFHVFKQSPPADLLTVLRTAVPQATIRIDSEGKRLTIVATPDDRALLESLLRRYKKIAPPEERNQLAIYTLKSADPAVPAGAHSHVPRCQVHAGQERAADRGSRPT